jgi:hypothetical protein
MKPFAWNKFHAISFLLINTERDTTEIKEEDYYCGVTILIWRQHILTLSFFISKLSCRISQMPNYFVPKDCKQSKNVKIDGLLGQKCLLPPSSGR